MRLGCFQARVLVATKARNNDAGQRAKSVIGGARSERPGKVFCRGAQEHR